MLRANSSFLNIQEKLGLDLKEHRRRRHEPRISELRATLVIKAGDCWCFPWWIKYVWGNGYCWRVRIRSQKCSASLHTSASAYTRAGNGRTCAEFIAAMEVTLPAAEPPGLTLMQCFLCCTVVISAQWLKFKISPAQKTNFWKCWIKLSHWVVPIR